MGYGIPKKRKTRKDRGKPKGKSGPQAEHPNLTFRNRPAKVNKDGSLRKVGFFKKGSKCSLILQHLQNGGKLTQLDCYPPSKFNTIRLGAIIKDLRDRGYRIETELIANKGSGKHARYYIK